MAPLPGICVTCAHETDARVPFSRRVRNARYSSNPMMGGGGLGIGLTWLLDLLSGKMHQEIVLRIPQCERCAAEKREVRIRSLDFENAVATLIVRREFRDALERAR
ncbi:MAG TPA: hypothetical protein VKB34_11890 [Povalibacter sp.]|nr:hypothetical protein [Povalibacter sp.]